MEILNTLNGSYVRDLLGEKKRIDGRGMLEFRDIKLATGMISNAEGSAQVDIGNTRIMAGIKMVPESPMSDTPGQGNMMVDAELLPMAHPNFEAGPPSPDSIEFARVVDRGIRAGNCIDLQSLVIDDEKVWGVFMDLYVLNYDGNLFDAGYLSAMAALLTTKVPTYQDGTAVHTEKDKSLKIDNVVASTTFGKIDDSVLLDMNMNEESIAGSRMTIATDGKELRAMQKGLNGSVTIPEISSMIDESFGHFGKLKDILDKACEK